MANEATGNDVKTRTRNILPGTHFHRIRRTVQSICFVIFVFLPLFDVMRVDLPRQRFYFFGAELWISEFAIIFLTMMFLWILVAAMAMIYGRFWCGYLCPQMIFSEAADGLEKRINRMINRKFSTLGPGGAACSVRRPLFRRSATRLRLCHLCLRLVFRPAARPAPSPAHLRHAHRRRHHRRQRHTGHVSGLCLPAPALLHRHLPYGYLQNMLADKHTLLVHFQEDPSGKCIHCEKCVRACPMGIDIRRSSHQLECTHCAECIDACSEVLGKMGRGSMIHYAWGDDEQNTVTESKWYRRIGLRDGKRVAILCLLLIYATGLSVAINLRQAVHGARHA